MIGTFSQPLLDVRDLRTFFGSPDAPVRAVDGVSLSIRSGETLALVGESGCGKSATALSLGRLLPRPPAFNAGGEILFEGENVLALPEKEMRCIRGSRIAYIFQEPAASLNPVQRVGDQIAEAIRLHRAGVKVRDEVVQLLDLVGIPEPRKRRRFFPHQLSGGQQQRVMIAIALAGQPKLLVADEPTTALDVTVQAQILELLQRLQRELGMAILLITHNLGIVAEIATSTCVMYAGRIVESGPTEEILREPKHPYTRALLNAVPTLEGGNARLRGIDGMVPSLRGLPGGCTFHPRCPFVQPLCRSTAPDWRPTSNDSGCRCHFWKEIAAGTLPPRGKA